MIQNQADIDAGRYGRHACPGRFFAANEMKILLVYALSMYDMRYPEGQAKPQSTWHGAFRTLDQSVHLEVKAREKPLVAF